MRGVLRGGFRGIGAGIYRILDMNFRECQLFEVHRALTRGRRARLRRHIHAMSLYDLLQGVLRYFYFGRGHMSSFQYGGSAVSTEAAIIRQSLSTVPAIPLSHHYPPQS